MQLPGGLSLPFHPRRSSAEITPLRTDSCLVKLTRNLPLTIWDVQCIICYEITDYYATMLHLIRFNLKNRLPKNKSKENTDVLVHLEWCQSMNENDKILERLKADASELWDRARTHSSAGKNNNERLEFLGNGVIDLCLAETLYQRFDERENKLSHIRNYLRSDFVLNTIGRRLGLDALILVSPANSGIKIEDSMVAGTLEAIFGALFLQKGYDESKEIVRLLFLTDELLLLANNPEPITYLKELAERNKWVIKHREYERMIAGKKAFYYAIDLNGKTTIGLGYSKAKSKLSATRSLISLIDE